MKKTVLIGALALLSGTLAAADIQRNGKVGLGLGAGYNTHAMADVNLGSSAAIQAGVGVDVDLKWHATEQLLAALELELIYPQRRESTDPSMPGFKALETYSALAVSLGAYYKIPVANVDYRLGGSLGMVNLSGANMELTMPGSTKTVTLGASGLAVKVGAGADWYLSQHWSLNADLGYRLASASPLTSDGKELKKANGDKFAVDYSGLYTKFGASFWF
jgi:hypothetical protein